jgi:hypothetical protein
MVQSATVPPVNRKGNAKVSVVIFLFLSFCFLIPVNASVACVVDEGPVDICSPPLTQNQCSCLTCWKSWSVGKCNYQGDPNGELMRFEGYSFAGCCDTQTGCLLCGGTAPTPACFPAGTKVSTPDGEKTLRR